jgi:O-antigen/teichoic acid export membrane protein
VKPIDRLLQARKSDVSSNLVARLGALAALATASLVVARSGGPAAVGVLALIRVLPWLVGLILTCGLFQTAPYFLAGPARSDPNVRRTIFAIAVVGGLVGSILWVLGSPILRHVFFETVPISLIAWAGVTVFTQVLESTAKACSQGTGDLRGANRVIFLEEFMFLPWYLLLVALGAQHMVAVVVALILGDVSTSLPAWIRLTRRGYFALGGRPSIACARDVIRFGMRAQVGSLILLLNARLDFAIVGLFLGPASLGIYAIASRYAELLRLPSLAINYVLYPQYARDGKESSAEAARAMIPRVGWIPAAAALPLALGATFILPIAYGPSFHAAVAPTFVLLLGLSGGGVAGVITAYLYGTGRPGLNSLAMGAGLVMTVALDLLLIPKFGVMGAAVASCVSYLTTAGVLTIAFAALTRGRRAPAVQVELESVS